MNEPPDDRPAGIGPESGPGATATAGKVDHSHKVAGNGEPVGSGCAHVPLRAFAYVCGGSAEERARIEGYFRERLEPAGFSWGGWFEDGVAAAARPLANRPGGLRLGVSLERGDAAIFAQARSFFGLGDLVGTIRSWATRGVQVHVLDLGLDGGTAAGREALALLARAVEAQGRCHGDRIRAAFAVRRRQGKPVGRPPYGFRCAGPRGDRRFVRDDYSRAIGRKIVEWKLAGHSWERIYYHLLEHDVTKRDGSEWSLGAIRRAYLGECRLLAREAEQKGRSSR